MVRKGKSEWRPVQLPKALVDTIEETIKTDKIKKQGITSISQFISRSVSKSIEEILALDYVVVKVEKYFFAVLDQKLKKVVIVDRANSEFKCKTCGSVDCPHVDYILSMHCIAPFLVEGI